jgi:hypothetical protein
MTEAEWLACDDFRQVFPSSNEMISYRQRAKWWAACCNHARDRLTEDQLEVVNAVFADPGSRTEQIDSSRFFGAVTTVLKEPNAHLAIQTHFLRDIVGNPFRPVTFDPAWRTSTVVALARQMDESSDFGAMPILADALQDAGCDSDAILNHCRDPNATHVRGCWVVDLVLGKQ